MKVKELIKKLEKMDLNLPVCIVEYSNMTGLRVLKTSDINQDNTLDYDYLDSDPIKGEFVRIEYGGF